MALATRCPACSTIFRIRTAQAAAKGGMVRCGQCRNVFNSLDALVRVEDLDLVDEAVAGRATASSVTADAPETTAPAHPEDDRFSDVPVTGFPQSEAFDVLASLSAPTQDHPTTSEWWMPDPAGRREPSTTRAPTSLHEPSPTAAIVAAPAPTDEPAPADLVAESAVAADAMADQPAAAWAADESGTGPVFMQPTPPAEPGHRAARWTWATLSVLALVLLLGQVTYLERDELAARWSPSRPWLLAACSMLGCKIDYPAHTESITIESATIQTPAPNANLYVLTALLRNRDTIDVRYPYLELVLTDVQDRTVLRRVLRPDDYVTPRAGGGLASPGFAAQSELPLRLTFELADLRFTGYRLDRFYP